MAPMIVIPFKHEPAEVILRLLNMAISHPSEPTVRAIGAEPNDTFAAVARWAAGYSRASLGIQERIGDLRPGKGDAMLTGMRHYLESKTPGNLHFYDADIESFSPQWITRAEAAIADGADIARHYFHRSSTDAQITWHVTRLGGALLWPTSTFARIQQPLGGEWAATRPVIKALWANPSVRRQSDWGIDTAITAAMCSQPITMKEVFVPEGKVHALYDGLSDLRTMLVECFSALQLVRAELVDPGPIGHEVEAAGPVPEALRSVKAFDPTTSVALLNTLLNEPEAKRLRSLGWNGTTLLDDQAWTSFLGTALRGLDPNDPLDADVLFRAWSARVLYHTQTNVPLGYERAVAALTAPIVNRLEAPTAGGHR